MDINTAQVAAAMVTALAPFMPILLETAKFSAGAIGEMIVQNGGEIAWQRAKVIWERLGRRYRDDGVITGAATMVAAAPENEDVQKVLATMLAECLAQEPALVQELVALLGGSAAVQQVLADKDSWVENVEQDLTGDGTQRVEAKDRSVIKGVRQVKK